MLGTYFAVSTLTGSKPIATGALDVARSGRCHRDARPVLAHLLRSHEERLRRWPLSFLGGQKGLRAEMARDQEPPNYPPPAPKTDHKVPDAYQVRSKVDGVCLAAHVEYIQERSQPTDTIYVWGWVPGIYVQAERLSRRRRPSKARCTLCRPSSLPSGPGDSRGLREESAQVHRGRTEGSLPLEPTSPGAVADRYLR